MAVLAFSLIALAVVVAITVVLLSVSTVIGIIAAVVGGLLAIPLVMTLIAQLDLLRMQGRYGFSHEEAEVFARLLPQIGGEIQAAGQSRRRLKRAAKERAAEIILAERSARRSGAATRDL